MWGCVPFLGLPNCHKVFPLSRLLAGILALAFGHLHAAVAARSSAPDYAKPKLSANRIFKLLDHKPTVDWESNKGNKLVSSVEISITCAYYLRWIKMSLKVFSGTG